MVTTALRPAQPQAVLHLRGATREEEAESSGGENGENTRRRIQWAEDVVDNEGLGRKSSKGGVFFSCSAGLSLPVLRLRSGI